MKYGYVRVSTEAQNIARQMEEMYKLGLTDEFIYVDKQSCKDFERENYKLLKEILKKDDLLIIKSIDRLGRNYDMIINEWSEITKVIEVDIFVIDFPLLDTREDGMNLVGNFVGTTSLLCSKAKLLISARTCGRLLAKYKDVLENEGIHIQFPTNHHNRIYNIKSDNYKEKKKEDKTQ